MSSKLNRGVIFISNVQKALEHEWFIDSVNKLELNLEFVLFNSKNSELFKYIKANGFKCKNYSLSSKYFIPFYLFFFWIKFLFSKYDFVHCHLLEASLIGIISSKWAGVKKRIHTRHHSDFHHTYFPHAIKYDLLINNYSTHIIAVSNNVKEILIEKEHVSINKVQVIPHGIPERVMQTKISEQEVSKMKSKYGLDQFSPIIGVVSRLTIWKGVQFIIPAFEKIVLEYPEAKLVLVNAQGDYELEISKRLVTLPENSYTLIKFENNMPALFKTFDVFVHVPIDKESEAFGQVYIESLCYEIPMICTLSGIANDLIVNEKNALVVEYNNSESIYLALKRILVDENLRSNIIENGKESVKEFTFEEKYKKIRELYLS